MSGTVGDTLREATRRLVDAGVPDAARDARRLLAHALGLAPGRLTLVLGDPIAESAASAFDVLVRRRSGREPVSHLVGRRSFYGRDFRVTPDVLDPRPETETLVEAALAEPFSRVLDLGTGTGCILLTLLAERPGAEGVGADISAQAIEVARANADALGIAATFVLSDWLSQVEGRFDLVVANPPYIAADEMPALAPEVRDHEPRLALTDEGDGLGAYRAILGGLGGHLAPGARVLFEIGPDQGHAVRAIAHLAGLGRTAVVPDLDGRDRVVVARAPGPSGP